MNLQVIIVKSRLYRSQGDMGLWGLCLMASRVIDKSRYGDGAVIDFAQAIKRTGKTVYNFAGAWETYVSLRRDFETNFTMWPQVSRFQEIRNGLPYSHFRAMGELMRRFEFSPVEAIGYLVDAMELGHSADRMTKDIEAEQDGHKKPPNKTEVFERKTSQAVYALEEATMNTDDRAMASAIAQAANAVRQVIEQAPDGEPGWYKAARFVRSGALSLARLDDVPEGLSSALIALADAIEQAMGGSDV